MSFPLDQIEELKEFSNDINVCEESGIQFVMLKDLQLPVGCKPEVCDVLLCPTQRDNYNSRLFFSVLVQSPQQRNWTPNTVRIVEKNWYVYSWKVNQTDLRLSQLLLSHLRALR